MDASRVNRGFERVVKDGACWPCCGFCCSCMPANEDIKHKSTSSRASRTFTGWSSSAIVSLPLRTASCAVLELPRLESCERWEQVVLLHHTTLASRSSKLIEGMFSRVSLEIKLVDRVVWGCASVSPPGHGIVGPRVSLRPRS